MDDKELAERVAKKLGWKQNKNEGDWTYAGEIVAYDEGEGDLENIIFDWPVFGLMVEHAEQKWGWMIELDSEAGVVGFHEKNGFAYKRKFFRKEHGIPKATAMAFDEIPEDTKN